MSSTVYHYTYVCHYTRFATTHICLTHIPKKKRLRVIVKKKILKIKTVYHDTYVCHDTRVANTHMLDTRVICLTHTPGKKNDNDGSLFA